MIQERLCSLEAVKQPGTPETGATGDLFNIAVLSELLFPYIIAEREAAVETEWKLVPHHVFPE